MEIYQLNCITTIEMSLGVPSILPYSLSSIFCPAEAETRECFFSNTKKASSIITRDNKSRFFQSYGLLQGWL